MSSAGKWAKNCLTPTPVRNSWGRYDLKVKAAGKSRSYIRMIAFPLIPAYDGPCKGELVPPQKQGLYEVDHLPRGPKYNASDKPDERDCRLSKLRVALEETNKGLFRKGWSKHTPAIRKKPIGRFARSFKKAN